MLPDLGFAPDRRRAVWLDERMHRELGLSLQHVFEAGQDVLRIDHAAARDLTDRLIGGERVAPGVFARYYELVEAIWSDDRPTAEALATELLAIQPAPAGMEVVALGPELGQETARYLRLVGDATPEVGFTAAPVEQAAAFRSRLRDGLALLDAALPELAGEIRGIVRQVVIAGSDPAKPLQFDGASHYQLWGALFLNAQFHPTRIAVAEVLAHESAHSLLFGFCTHEPLVENEDEELFASPLRPDARPMDGIYHATYVSARMHWAMSRLAASTHVTPDEREAAARAAEADARNFHAGDEVVRTHGRLTRLGEGLMAAARDAMHAAEPAIHAS